MFAYFDICVVKNVSYVVINFTPNWCWANIFLKIYFKRIALACVLESLSLLLSTISKRMFHIASNWVFHVTVVSNRLFQIWVVSNLYLWVILFSILSSILLKSNSSWMIWQNLVISKELFAILFTTKFKEWAALESFGGSYVEIH